MAPSSAWGKDHHQHLLTLNYVVMWVNMDLKSLVRVLHSAPREGCHLLTEEWSKSYFTLLIIENKRGYC